MHWKTQLTSLKYSGGCQIESVKQATVSTECRNPVELFSCLLVMDHWLWATLTRQECNGNLWNGWKCNAFGENNRAKLFKTRGNECFIMCPCYSMHYQLIRSSSDLHYESPWQGYSRLTIARPSYTSLELRELTQGVGGPSDSLCSRTTLHLNQSGLWDFHFHRCEVKNCGEGGKTCEMRQLLQATMAGHMDSFINIDSVISTGFLMLM